MSRIQTRDISALSAKGLAIAALAIGAGVLFSGTTGHEPNPLVGVDEMTTPPPTAIIQMVEFIPDISAKMESLNPIPVPPTLLADTVPLDEATQRMVYEMCGEKNALFCMVMAIANRESRFTLDAVGDGGNSIGMMQINTYWQRDRIADLGVTDLADIEQNMAVALNYIDWLATRIEPDDPESTYGTHSLFMAYNMGLTGAMDAWERGVLQTGYSVSCCEYFQMYMTKLEVRT